MAGGWRYFATRFNGDGTEDVLDLSLALEGVSTSRLLSGPHSLSGTIRTDSKRLVMPDGSPLFQRWGTGIYGERADGQIRGGILADYSIGADDALSLDVVGLTAYAKDQPYVDSVYFIEEDPLNIFRHGWAHLQTQPMGNIGLQLDSTTSPVRIGTQIEDVNFQTSEGQMVAFEAGPYKYNWYTTDDLGGVMDTLAAETPFDYLEHHYWDGEELRHRLQIGYPEIGVARGDLRFILGENVWAIPSRTLAGEDVASAVLTLGTGEGRDKKRGYAARQPVGHLRRVRQIDDNTLKTQASVDARSAAELAAVTGEAQITDLVVKNHRNAPFGSFDVGDTVVYAGAQAWGNVEQWVKIVKITEDPDASEDLKLTVAAPVG